MTRSAVRVARALGIERGEERVLAWSAAALFAVSWASISVANVADTFFLKRVGVDRLPWVFLLNSVLLTGTTFVVGRLALRYEPRRLLIATLGFLAVALVPLWMLVVGNVTSAFVLLVLAAKQLDAITLVVFWTAVGSLVSGRQGKRLFARISAGGTLGAIAGSFTSGWLGRTFGIDTLLPIASVTMLFGIAASVPLLRRQRARFHRVGPGPVLVDDDAGRRLGPLWRAGALFRVLVLASLLAGILGPILYFEFAFVADQATQGHGGEQRLLDLYALFRGWLNVGVLLIQIVGTPAVFRRLGVPLASALSPLIYFLGLVGLSVQLSLAAGVAAVAGANLQDHAVYDPAQRILVTLFPERVRAAVTTLIDGPVSTSAVLGNLVIIAALYFAGPVLGRGFAGLTSRRREPSSRSSSGASIRLPPQVATARHNDFEDPRRCTELLDGGTVRLLRRQVATRPERCRAACDILSRGDPARAVRALAPRAPRPRDRGTRPYCVATLHQVRRARWRRAWCGEARGISRRRAGRGEAERSLPRPGEASACSSRAHLVRAVRAAPRTGRQGPPVLIVRSPIPSGREPRRDGGAGARRRRQRRGGPRGRLMTAAHRPIARRAGGSRAGLRARLRRPAASGPGTRSSVTCCGSLYRAGSRPRRGGALAQGSPRAHGAARARTPRPCSPIASTPIRPSAPRWYVSSVTPGPPTAPESSCST
jgi:AAA family ATP:ADP antiporter